MFSRIRGKGESQIGLICLQQQRQRSHRHVQRLSAQTIQTQPTKLGKQFWQWPSAEDVLMQRMKSGRHWAWSHNARGQQGPTTSWIASRETLQKQQVWRPTALYTGHWANGTEKEAEVHPGQSRERRTTPARRKIYRRARWDEDPF